VSLLPVNQGGNCYQVTIGWCVSVDCCTALSLLSAPFLHPLQLLFGGLREYVHTYVITNRTLPNVLTGDLMYSALGVSEGE